ncbi:ABC transporter substrate-binding protein [Cohnella panacarvi]|uniref:ABC transporter substrate-binding protein n=1 Tax=Cohnella panacarvi TaxID=400776 RepID=UPI00047DEB0D|nr:ABC transporter substrate-binding protein [Cohnella panacarvi]
MLATAERYLTILNAWDVHPKDGETIEVTIEQLASAWFCTTRNAKMIVRKLCAESMIEWHAGRGRGNRSRLVLLAERDAVLLACAREIAGRGEYKGAFEWLEAYGRESTAKEKFVSWLSEHFGYGTERTEGERETDVLRFPVNKPIVSLDPADIHLTFDAHMIRQLFDRLVQYDNATDRIVGCLAHAWKRNADATEWIFHLRKGIRFHHGREVNSDDVRFTFERLRESKSHGWLFRELKEIVCDGPRSVCIRLNKPNTIFLKVVGYAAASILPRELVEADEQRFWKLPVGSGPFRVARWTEDRFEMVANTDYHLGRAHLDRVVIAFLPEKETTTETLSAEWLQQLNGYALDQRVPQTGWKTVERLMGGCMLMTWNSARPGPQRSKAFRKAMAAVIDRMSFIRANGQNRYHPAIGFHAEDSPAFAVADTRPDIEAERLLADADYDGETLHLATFNGYAREVEWIRSRCERFGVNLNVRFVRLEEIKDERMHAEVDCILCNITMGEDEVWEIENYEQTNNFLKAHLPSDVLRWIRLQVDAMLACDDPASRRAYLSNIEMRLRLEQHVLFLWHKKISTYVHPDVKDARLNALGWMDFKQIWLNVPASL